MTSTKQVGIKELKNRLSSYLREVKNGRRILVTDRGEVIAELHRARPVSDPAEEVIKEWLEAGEVVPPARAKKPLPKPLVRLPGGTSLEILDELRGG
jgi:antitoxin (DNA-binding transcriptional repressor) of toxin-antitoxin stability system